MMGLPDYFTRAAISKAEYRVRRLARNAEHDILCRIVALEERVKLLERAQGSKTNDK